MNRFCSIFSQLLQLFPNADFLQAVKKTKAERHCRGFTCWRQFVAMLFCQLGCAHSLQEITGGLRSREDKLKHLGITDPSHSTLSYANAHRLWELYQEIFFSKDRWQIEAFFRALKQNLKIKTFVGISSNAVKIQVWTAFIAMLILRYLQLFSRFPWSLSDLVALLRMNLFSHRDPWPGFLHPLEHYHFRMNKNNTP